MILIVGACRRELTSLPAAVRADLADALARLDEGLVLSMPLSRPMPSIGAGVHELRLRDRSGQYRVIYALIHGGTVYVLRAFAKKSATTPTHEIALARQRLKEIKP